MDISTIKTYLPYQAPFLFVDEITSVDEMGIEGHYTYKETEFFYQGHFPGNPITPGVILTETMAQIGLVCFGIYLMRNNAINVPQFAFTASNVEFYKMVLPKEKVIVSATKLYFRLGKLKCQVSMNNEAGDLISKGEMSGMMIKK